MALMAAKKRATRGCRGKKRGRGADAPTPPPEPRTDTQEENQT